MSLETNPALRRSVIYELYVRSHTPQGTFRAVESDLPRIRALGTDILWLMPIHPIGEANRKGSMGCPYANRDYRTVNPEYGTLEDFLHLVDAIHDNGMKCIIDVVYNHTSPDATLVALHPEYYYHKPDGSRGNKVGDWTDVVDLDYAVPGLWDYQIESLCYWAQYVDGFRCDMAEMVPTAFWSYASQRLKAAHPEAILIGEVYNPALYRAYIASGFDYLYDKVGMYDCLRGVVCQQRAASEITAQWQATDDIRDRMLYFLENHDEQRIASDFFCGDARKALPAMMVSAWLRTNPVMVYAGQEWGERGMDHEGFSGVDGRSTIFDYWTVQAVYQGYFDRSSLGVDQRQLEADYQQILQLANEEKALREGELFDLMYANAPSPCFDPQRQYAFLRKKDDELLIVNANFSADQRTTQIRIPAHAFDFFHIGEGEYEGLDLLTGQCRTDRWDRDGEITLHTQGYGATIVRYKV